MEQQHLTARQKMRLRIAQQRRALVAGKAKLANARKQVESALLLIEQAGKDIQAGEVIDLDLPETALHLKELSQQLQESVEHIDRHIERKHL